MVTPVVKRDAVPHLQVFHGMSERQACQVLGADRTTIRYCSRRADDEVLREKLRAGSSDGAAQPALEPRLGARPVGEWPPVPGTQRGR